MSKREILIQSLGETPNFLYIRHRNNNEAENGGQRNK